MHSVAPVEFNVLVIDPTGHTAHALVESVPYSPTGHIVQIVAPLLASVSVNDPAAHTLHASVELSLNWPAAHSAHIDPALPGTFGAAEWSAFHAAMPPRLRAATLSGVRGEDGSIDLDTVVRATTLPTQAAAHAAAYRREL